METNPVYYPTGHGFEAVWDGACERIHLRQTRPKGSGSEAWYPELELNIHEAESLRDALSDMIAELKGEEVKIGGTD